MINNYYNIPNIPCNARENIVSSPINQQKCNGLNPDQVYDTLYPSDADPLVDYTAHNSKKLTTGTRISSSITNTTNCAKSCNDKNDCTYFTVEKDKNKCLLYRANSTSANDKFNSLSASNKLQTWRKNNLLEGSSNCNLEDNFIQQPTNFFQMLTTTKKHYKPSHNLTSPKMNASPPVYTTPIANQSSLPKLKATANNTIPPETMQSLKSLIHPITIPTLQLTLKMQILKETASEHLIT